MKNKLLKTLMVSAVTVVAANFISPAASHAQAVAAASDPVGYITMNIKSAPAPGTFRFSAISPTLVNETDFQGEVVSNGASTITVAAASFGAGDYDELAPAGPSLPNRAAYYVEVTTGTFAGAWTNIVSNTTDTLTTSDDLSSVLGTVATDAIKIRKHVTIADLLGANNEAGLDDGTSITDSDEVLIFQSGGGGTTTLFFVPDLDPGPGVIGQFWSDTSFNNHNEDPIPPHQGLVVKRKVSGADLQFTRSGHVKTGPTLLKIESGFNYMGIVSPVGEDDTPSPVFTLGTSALQDVLTQGASITAADEVALFQPDGTTISFFYIPDLDPGPGVIGEFWSDTSFNNHNDDIIAEGTAIFVNRKFGGGVNWVHPEPIIAAP